MIVDIFKYLLLSDDKFTDTDSCSILMPLITASSQKSEFLDESSIVDLVESVVHILIEDCCNKRKYRDSAMIIKYKKLDPKLFEPLKRLSLEKGSELESILQNPSNDSIYLSKLKNAKEILTSFKGVLNVA